MSNPFEKIKTKIIGIAGCGGLGTHAAISLARTGVKKIILADYDVVEIGNLTRQFFYWSQIGQKKVKALRKIIKDINPYVKVDIFDVKLDRKNIPRIFKDADILIEALDAPIEKSKLITVFKKHFPDKPIISASGLAGLDSANKIKTKKLGNNIWIVGDNKNEAKIGVPILCSRVAITANQQVHQAVRLLVKKKGKSNG